MLKKRINRLILSGLGLSLVGTSTLTALLPVTVQASSKKNVEKNSSVAINNVSKDVIELDGEIIDLKKIHEEFEKENTELYLTL